MGRGALLAPVTRRKKREREREFYWELLVYTSASEGEGTQPMASCSQRGRVLREVVACWVLQLVFIVEVLQPDKRPQLG